VVTIATAMRSGGKKRRDETDHDRDIRDVERGPEPKIDEVDDRSPANDVEQIPGRSAESRAQTESCPLPLEPAQPEA